MIKGSHPAARPALETFSAEIWEFPSILLPLSVFSFLLALPAFANSWLHRSLSTAMADPTAIEQFVLITGADESTANFFLSAAHGNCDAAVSTFFESDGMIPQTSENPRPARPTPASSSRAPPSNPPDAALSQPRRRNPQSGGIATLGSLARERDDDEKGYYAGGEKSGQMIQDPRKRNAASSRPAPSAANAQSDRTEDDDEMPAGLADSILERARARGPRTEEEHEHFEGPQRFAGAGYRLGATADPPQRPTVVGRRNVTRVLTFYANGFRVDEGPLRAFDDPANEAFLADVNRGVVPKEMEEPDIGDISITLVDRKGVDYEEERSGMVPFSGGGQRLNDAEALANSSQAPSAQVTTDAAEAVLIVDSSRPITRVQVRLSDGTRLVARLNEDSTVGQLRSFVRASRPGVANFVLSTTFPKKLLDDDSKTIVEAELKGAVVVQTLK